MDIDFNNGNGNIKIIDDYMKNESGTKKNN